MSESLDAHLEEKRRLEKAILESEAEQNAGRLAYEGKYLQLSTQIKDLKERLSALITRDDMIAESTREIAALNQTLQALTASIASIKSALVASENKTEVQGNEIKTLNERLIAAAITNDERETVVNGLKVSTCRSLLSSHSNLTRTLGSNRSSSGTAHRGSHCKFISWSSRIAQH